MKGERASRAGKRWGKGACVNHCAYSIIPTHSSLYRTNSMELRGRIAPDDPPTTTDRSAIGRLPIDHQFSIEPDGEIFSRQCLTVPPTWLPLTFKVHAALLEGLGPLYFKRLLSLSRGLIRVRERAGEICFEVGGLGVPLLIFAPAIQTEEAAGGHLCYTIRRRANEWGYRKPARAPVSHPLPHGGRATGLHGDQGLPLAPGWSWPPPAPLGLHPHAGRAPSLDRPRLCSQRRACDPVRRGSRAGRCKRGMSPPRTAPQNRIRIARLPGLGPFDRLF